MIILHYTSPCPIQQRELEGCMDVMPLQNFAACGVGTCQCLHSGPRVASRSILTSVHLHIPSTNTGQGGVHSGSSPSPSRWLQVPVSWQGRGGPQCPGGTWIHAGPRVPSHLMALEIGASAALEQPEKPRLARGPGHWQRLGHSGWHQLRAKPGRTEPASRLECSVHADDTNPFINIQSLAVP
jgi:hypothetical protein